MTERDHLQAYAKATGETPPDLILPPIPPGCQVLWEAFLELNGTRASAGMGPCAITYHDILSWQALMGVTLNPWELRVIQALDQVAIKSASEQNDKPND